MKSGVIAEEGDWVRVHVVTRRRARRWHIALRKHGGEPPRIRVLLSLHSLSLHEKWGRRFLDREIIWSMGELIKRESGVGESDDDQRDKKRERDRNLGGVVMAHHHHHSFNKLGWFLRLGFSFFFPFWVGFFEMNWEGLMEL